MKQPKIESWNIKVYFKGRGRPVNADMPDDVSQVVDDWLTEMEKRVCPKCFEEMYEPDVEEAKANKSKPMWYCPRCKKNIREYKEEEWK